VSQVLPPLDLHAHIETGIAPRALEALGAVVFVATRSINEYERVRKRGDAVTVWGLGCHPGVVAAQDAFDEDQFARLLATTPFISEVGLDGGSSVPIDRQAKIFASILAQAARTPRLVSVHSKGAPRRTLDIIEKSGAEGVILHWWLGSDADTRRALQLNCLFSVNRSMELKRLKDRGVPLASILPETDHPGGNRRGDGPKQPGWTLDVERSLGAVYDVPAEQVRQQSWHTLTQQVDLLGVEPLLPPVIRAMMAHARQGRGEV
jgi:TatD DNase family protein